MTTGSTTIFDSNLIWFMSNGSTDSHSKVEIQQTMSKICKERGVKFRWVQFEDVVISIEYGSLGLRIKGKKIKYFPLVAVVRVPAAHLKADSEITVLRHLELIGCRLINPSSAILKCVNKVWTFQELAGNGFPLPNTFSYGGHSNLLTTLKTVDTNLVYPVVVKNCRGYQGQSVFLARDRMQLIDTSHLLKHESPYLFQQYIRESHGRDVRVIVIGERIVGAMLRQSSDGRMQSNCAAGGRGELYQLPPEGEKLALDVARCLRLDICGIDLLVNNDGSFWICEVNCNPGFKHFNTALQMNVAESITELALQELERLREVRKLSTVTVADTSDYYSDHGDSCP